MEQQCSSIEQYLTKVARIEGYRSARELLCNYFYNFRYSFSDFNFHMRYIYKVHYSNASYRAAYRRIIKGKRSVRKRKRKGGFKYRKVEDKYTRITRQCLGYRTFHEALYHLINVERLSYRQIANLYGVSKGALQYRVKMERRINSSPTF